MCRRFVVQVMVIGGVAARVFAQGAPPMQMPMPADHHMMAMSGPLGIDDGRNASGTSWQPAASPMAGGMWQRGAWMLMLHGNGFLQYIDAGSDRGDRQLGSINWLMGMADRDVGPGRLTLRSMFSIEPLTVGRCGYPTLLASGEQCRGVALHDQQHPHDLFMELAAQYRRAIADGVALELYGGAAGEPALGPTGFAHRLSALPNPIAPIAHHWLDSTHVSFGVITGGVYGRRWKAEASLFNGREPDDERYGLDEGALDSYSGRVWLMPTSNWAVQVSAGHLNDAEQKTDGTRETVNRVTASATYHRVVNAQVTAATVAWGRNREPGHATSALTAEIASDVTAHDILFARAELAGKSAQDLAVAAGDDATFTIGKVQTGYTRWLGRLGGGRAGAGAAIGFSIVPERLKFLYGGTVGAETVVFVTFRSGPMQH